MGSAILSSEMSKGNTFRRQQILQGTLDLMVLKTLDAIGPRHGYGIARRLEQLSGEALETTIRKVFETVDTGSPVYHVRKLESYYSERLASRTFALVLLGLLGALAVALSAVGVYGVISYSVSQRSKEVGIRMALGAERRHVMTLILLQVLPVVAAGLAIGFAVSLALASTLVALLFEVTPTDPVTSVAVATLLGSAVLAATAIPAHRAATLDPVTTLRCE
jgi:ABC-type antimicrobial peptide transport system permease subunit